MTAALLTGLGEIVVIGLMTWDTGALLANAWPFIWLWPLNLVLLAYILALLIRKWCCLGEGAL
jgi:hypothetical protein